MKRLAKIVAISMALFVGCAFVIPAQLGTLDSHAAKVSISKTKVTLVKGKTTTLTMKGTKSKAKWSSTNKSVATVTSSGKVTAKKAGKATIVAKISSKQYKCAVTVKNPPIIEGSPQKPSDPYHGVSVKTEDGSFYFELTGMLLDRDAIHALEEVDDWDSYDEEQYNQLYDHTFLLLGYFAKATEGYKNRPLKGTDIISPLDLYDEDCEEAIPNTDFKTFHTDLDDLSPLNFRLFNGESGEMYLALYVPNGHSSFTTWISSTGGLSEHWVKYDLY